MYPHVLGPGAVVVPKMGVALIALTVRWDKGINWPVENSSPQYQ